MSKASFKLCVLDRGAHHVAVYKPANMVVVGGPGAPRPTLLDLARKELGKNVFPVHRLDRVTSGIVLFATSSFGKMALDLAFKKRLVKKRYLAVCEGEASFSKQTIRSKLKRVDLPKSKGPLALQTLDEKGQEAITHIKVLAKKNGLTLVEAQPITGRLHQIRIHLSSIGLPIVGDNLYGAKQRLGVQEIALIAAALDFPQPKGPVRHIELPLGLLSEGLQKLFRQFSFSGNVKSFYEI